MFGPTTATRVFAATGATDMRTGFDGLFGLVRDVPGEDPLSGHLFLFANRDRTRINIEGYPLDSGNRATVDCMGAVDGAS